MKKKFDFERGPIRPPNEAQSLLLRVTRNCPWNQCLFCPVYKKKKFSMRSVEEIKEDIQAARDIADEIKALSWRMGQSGRVTAEVANAIFSQPDQYSDGFQMLAGWLYFNTGACFLQDADNLVMPTADLIAVLEFLKEKFPEIQRVTTYSRSRTIVRRSVAELSRIKAAGLDRVHVGMESGFDSVLKLVKKGVSAAQHIEAGGKIIAAGLELSEYVMPGLGGQEFWREHAVETARVLNQINPHFIRIRSLRIPTRVLLYEKLQSGEFKMQTDDEIAEELKLFISSLEGISSTVTSDHIMNLLEEVSGKLPEDKERMLGIIERYQALPDAERLIYRLGRRGGAYRSTDDLTRDPVTYQKLKSLVREVVNRDGPQGVERMIAEMVDQYI
jgi:hypothetical protein